jgi:hypothetical protein
MRRSVSIPLLALLLAAGGYVTYARARVGCALLRLRERAVSGPTHIPSLGVTITFPPGWHELVDREKDHGAMFMRGHRFHPDAVLTVGVAYGAAWRRMDDTQYLQAVQRVADKGGMLGFFCARVRPNDDRRADLCLGQDAQGQAVRLDLHLDGDMVIFSTAYRRPGAGVSEQELDGIIDSITLDPSGP